jgi:preprotein translocase subunit SecA
MRQIERVAILSTIDEKWMDHLDEMDNLRDGIWLRGDKTTVLSEYKKEGFNMFEELISSIESAVAQRVFRVHVQDQAMQAAQPLHLIEQKAAVFGNLAQQAAQDPVSGSAPAVAPQSTKGSASDLAAALAGAKGGKKLAPGLAQVKVGRNDPCPCGAINPQTGKVYKYKQCGLVNAPWHLAG